jgi:hypothetical protein
MRKLVSSSGIRSVETYYGGSQRKPWSETPSEVNPFIMFRWSTVPSSNASLSLSFTITVTIPVIPPKRSGQVQTLERSEQLILLTLIGIVLA